MAVWTLVVRTRLFSRNLFGYASVMEQLKYTIILEKEDDGFVVTAPALPGCITQGETREEALANAREAIEAYLEDSREPVNLFRARVVVSTSRYRSGRSEAVVAKLPADVSGRRVRAALEKVAFICRRQRGSHIVLRREAFGDHPALTWFFTAWSSAN